MGDESDKHESPSFAAFVAGDMAKLKQRVEGDRFAVRERFEALEKCKLEGWKLPEVSLEDDPKR